MAHKTEASLRAAHAKAVSIRDNQGAPFAKRFAAGKLAARLAAQLEGQLAKLRQRLGTIPRRSKGKR